MMRMPAASAPVTRPHSAATNGSLTVTQTISSTPLARNSAAVVTKLGMWVLWQVGVKAPGTPNSATVLPAKTSALATGAGPFSVISNKVAAGRRSPTEMVMLALLQKPQRAPMRMAPSRRITSPFI